ncbi:MAG: FtsX-like permease family protein, partial [Calditrichia bacterium]|nr:FtsX-like permease family protein [Calditrichia bacterium]
TSKIERLVVGLYNTENLDKALAEAKQIIPENLKIRTWNELAVYYKKVLQFFYQIVGFLTIVLMIIVWFSSMNTIMMSILERIEEFATLRAMGTSLKRMFALLLSEGMWLGLIGVITGVMLELLFSWIINNSNIMMPPPPGQANGYQLAIRNSLSNFIMVGAITWIIVVLSGILPSFKVFKANVAQALRGQS